LESILKNTGGGTSKDANVFQMKPIVSLSSFKLGAISVKVFFSVLIKMYILVLIL